VGKLTCEEWRWSKMASPLHKLLSSDALTSSFFITSIHVYPHYRLRHNQQGQPSCLALPSRGTWWSHPGAWKWGANKIQLQFGTIWSSSPCNNLGFHVKSWFVRCIPSIKQGSMATQLRPTSINRAH
jgi:hypothetical protein